MGKANEMKKPRRTKEEIESAKILKEFEKQRRKEEKKRKAELNKKTEKELVHQYANIIISKQKTRGMVKDSFKDIREKKHNKDLWQDANFYFSVVFQSYEQKFEFLKKLNRKFPIPEDDMSEINTMNILNGLVLAKVLGIDLNKEIANNFPLGNIELKDLVLDDETV